MSLLSLRQCSLYVTAICAVFFVAIVAHAQTSTSGVPDAASVYQVTQLDGNQNFGNFVVGPGKFELELAPGQAQEVQISITNRSGERKRFDLTTEDLIGSDDPNQPTVLLGDDRGPYTLKDYLSVPADSFYIEPGQRVTVPITVALPADVEPGGHYGSLLVQTASAGGNAGNAPSAAVVSRIAVLFFITSPGEQTRSGQLTELATVPKQTYFATGPITFGLLYQNTGSIHVNPYGEIQITNMLGDEVGRIEIEPWFALPQSTRLREVTWQREQLFGRYTATAEINRGYDNIIDTKEITFWVIDTWMLVRLFGIVFVVLLVIWFVFSRFEFKRK